ncbi:MAG: hypothetical protein RLZZ399_2178 [Verrucomicrobiota bacterium]|jgi:hypothetical protein
MTPFAKESDFEAAVVRDPSVDPCGARAAATSPSGTFVNQLLGKDVCVPQTEGRGNDGN